VPTSASSTDTTKNPTGLRLYTLAAERSASAVIASYSTSFGWATALLGESVRQDVKNIYALVRVADEIVDGAAADALAASAAAGQKSSLAPSKALDELEAETYRAIESGFSTNLVVHAFASTARRVQIGKDLIAPFFHSMRMDLTEQEHDQQSFDLYVYGSAEVVGLMCLQAFMWGKTYSDADRNTMVAGARALGSAFQKVNFLRDLAADFKRLGRSYFPGVSVGNFTEADKVRLVEDIRVDLKTSAASLPLLPKTASKAVAAAQMLFEALNERIADTPATRLIEARIRVADPQKLVILTKALIGVLPK
jgi:phytoene synthase